MLPSFYEAFNPDQFPRMESPIGFMPISLWMALLHLSPVALLLVFAGFLWVKADFVATKIVGERDENIAPVSSDQDVNLQSLAFSILGAYVLTIALPRLSQLLIHAWNVGSQDTTLRQDWTGFAPNLVFASAEIALALYLLFGARGLVTLLADVRNIGRDRQLQRQENDDDSVSLRPEK